MPRVETIYKQVMAMVLLIGAIGMARLFFIAGTEIKHTSSRAQQTLQSVDQSTAKIAKSIDDLKVMLNATLYQVGDASHEVANTAREQKKYWDQTGQQTVLAMKQLNEVLAQTKDTVSGIDSSRQQIAETVNTAVASVNQTLITSQSTLASATQAIQGINVVVSNPSIPNTLQHLDTMSAELRDTAAEANGAAKDLRKAIHDWTKPKSIAKSIFGFLLDTTSKIAVIFK